MSQRLTIGASHPVLGLPRFRHWLGATTALIGVGLLAGGALAQPNQPSVVAGQATIGQTGAATTITQSTDKAIINWNSFSTDPGESVKFTQPGPGSISLNRVTGAEASKLKGSLSANGQVLLVNPSGVIIGPTGSVDVNGLVATTSNITNQDFLNNRLRFGQPAGNASATVANQGRITTAPGGYAVLSAPVVENSGTIRADVGTVVLGGAKTFTLDLNGDKLLSYAITGPVEAAPLGPDGKPVSALVSNGGTIQADGGTVTLTARAAKGIVDGVINAGGKIQASRAYGRGGVVVIDGDDSVVVGGSMITTGATSLDTGGQISVLGDKVSVAGTASLDASGPAGGGAVKIGGDFRGAAGTRAAVVTTVAKGATIKSDATAAGDGGTVVVWSDKATSFDGAISARALATGARGGTVETSSKGSLGITTGRVTTAAPAGTAGSWLLDPSDVTIAIGGVNANIVDGGFGPTYQPTANQTVNPQSILAALDNGNVTIDSGGGNGGAGNVFVNSAIKYTGSAASTLQINAAGSVAVNSSMSAPLISITAGDVLNVANGVSINATIAPFTGNLSNTLFLSGNSVTLAANSSVIGALVQISAQGAIVANGSITGLQAGWNNVALDGNGVSVAGSINITAGLGDIRTGSGGFVLSSGASLLGSGGTGYAFNISGGGVYFNKGSTISIPDMPMDFYGALTTLEVATPIRETLINPPVSIIID